MSATPPLKRRTRKKKSAGWTPIHFAGLGVGALAVFILGDQLVSLMNASPDVTSRPIQVAAIPPATDPVVNSAVPNLPTALPDNFDLSAYSGDPTVDSDANAVTTAVITPNETPDLTTSSNESSPPHSKPVAYHKIIGLRPYLPPPPGINLSATDSTGIELSSGFECSLRNVDIKTIAPQHFEVKFQSGRDYTGFFAFQLKNAQGQQVIIDFAGVPSKWHTLNPVYCNDYNAFLRDEPPRRAGSVNSLSSDFKPSKARNGALLPDTTSDHWHYIPDVTVADKKLRITHTYDSDDVMLAMRPIFSPTYLNQYVQRLKSHPEAVVHHIGDTPQGRPLFVIEVSDRNVPDYRLKPTLLIYAREHGDEHDSSWLTQGAVDYFLSDDREAQRLLKQVNLLVIPILDPDGAANATYHRMVDTFRMGNLCQESTAWADFFVHWYNGQGRVDAAISLHNVESAEASHLACGSIPKSMPDHEWSQGLHVYIGTNMKSSNFKIEKKIWGPDNYYHRLTKFLEERYRTLWLLYEVNSQAKDQHLSLDQMRDMGGHMARATALYLTSKESKPLRDRVWNRQRQRFQYWLHYQPDFDYRPEIRDPVSAEIYTLMMPSLEELNPKAKTVLEKRLEAYPHFQ
ncbi:M14 family zinc carboxypeptidase [Lacunimicrobium album]